MFEMKNWVPVFLIAAALCGVINSESISICEEARRTDAECGSYCYAVSKPLLQMAPLCHRKDQEISELKDKLQDLQRKVTAFEAQESQCKILDELTSLRSAVESMANSRVVNTSDASIELKKCQDRLSNTIGCRNSRTLQQTLTETRDRLKKCLDKDANTTNVEESKAEAKPEYPSNCLGSKRPIVILKVQVPDIAPFRVRCNNEIAGPGWMVIQQQVKGSLVDFERNWETYRSGFGDLHGSHFIGLEKLYHLTKSQPHELYIHMVTFQEFVTQAYYDNFRVDSEAEGYRLIDLGKYSGGAGDAGDALSFNNNQKFSTLDRDNDSYDRVHCAREFRSGWWHNNCTESNLNGIYMRTDEASRWGIWWRPWQIYTPFKAVHMLIRPKQ
ncbi:angiopoietin-related protein 7-like [Drosophila nasuta]|uniref:angiopoietin-related protein 7-like n=1 Tax=Drosophila nasuta TaxID=42062 RepID=UPI00295E48C3|nr:angiopoietin-related protein 7-like [Drosophila nasuta]